MSKVGFSPRYSSSSSSSPSLRRSTALKAWYNKKKANDDDGGKSKKAKKTNKINKGSLMKKNGDAATDVDSPSISLKLEELKEAVVQKVLSLLPEPLIDVLSIIFEKLGNLWPSLRIATLSFVAGAILMLTAILVPVYSSVETLSEPVTLFETILADLDAGYVDEVDTNKLFETGVSAMLRSLDPYTEFEAREEAQQLTEGIMGKYGGVGLVIAGVTPKDIAEMRRATAPPVQQQQEQMPQESKLLPQDAIQDSMPDSSDVSSSSSSSTQSPGVKYVDMSKDDTEDEDPDDEEERMVSQNREDQLKALTKAQEKGIRVVSAFEGYAFDYGMRVGDKLKQVDDLAVTTDTSVEDVRNVLRGEPGTMVTLKFEREGVDGIQEITMPRAVVQLRDVKLATLVGNPKDGIGYVSLSGFAASAGSEVRGAILALEQAAVDASNGAHSLKGLILDLRGNPGGLLTSAVDVASLLVPKDSDIVSAKGRGFPGVIYRSRVDPLLDPQTKLAVLVNRGTASAAEIVSGAVQDLDRGVVIGTDRTFGKGLVQNVEDLPFNTALKFTVAKYYTPSGRCIQGVQYKEGGGLRAEDGRYTSSRVSKKDRQVFHTKSGRIVRDGGGVEADFKVPAPKASALEVTLLRSDIMNEFAALWSRKYELTHNFEVTDDMYREFQDFVEAKRKSGDIKLESLYSSALDDLKRALKQSGYKDAGRQVEQLQSLIVKEIRNDFEKYKKDIKEDIAVSILSRYLPESFIMERGLKTDTQVLEATKLLASDRKFDKILGIENPKLDGSTMKLASSDLPESKSQASFRVSF